MEAISLNYARRVADLVACSEKDGIARRFTSCFAGRGEGRAPAKSVRCGAGLWFCCVTGVACVAAVTAWGYW